MNHLLTYKRATAINAVVLFFLMTFYLLTSGCRRETATASDCPELNLLESSEVVSLDGYIDTVETIKLAGDSVRVVYPKKILVSKDNLIVLSSGEVNVFATSGRFLRHIGRKGNGPGEYLFVMDCCVSVDGREVLCLNNSNSVYRYSLEDGKFIGKVDSRMRGTASAVLPLAKGGFALYFANPTDKQVNDYSEDFYCLKFFNSEGSLKEEKLLREDFNILLSFRPQSIQNMHNQYVLSYLPGDGPCYLCDGSNVRPEVSFSFGGKGLPDGFTRGSSNPIEMIGDIFESEWYKSVSSVCITPEMLFCSAFGGHSAYWNFIFDRHSGKGIRWQSFGMEAPPMSPLCSDETGFYFSFEERRLPVDSPVEIKDPLVRELATTYGVSIGDEDNPSIVKVKFKF